MTTHKSKKSGGFLKTLAMVLLVVPFSPIILLIAAKKHSKGAEPSNDRGIYGPK